MVDIRIIRRIPHRIEDLYELVTDVENYPDFIDLITALRVTKTISDTEFEAEAIVAYKMLRERFRSHIKLNPDAKNVHVSKAQKGGAVKDLHNVWQFHPMDDGSTLVDVQLEVTLKSRTLEYILREKFDKAAIHIMNLFETHAAKTYPKVGTQTYDAQVELKRLGFAHEGLIKASV